MSQDLEPQVSLNQKHDDVVFQQSLIPDTLYRLRLSVLKDNAGHFSCPSRIFTFTSVTSLEAATKTVTDEFGSGISACEIQKTGVLEVTRGTEDGRTEDLTLEYDSVTADEDWEEFLSRIKSVGMEWETEEWVDKEKSYGRQVCRGVEFPEYT